MRKYKYIFGPVLSRRLGLSLGVDLVPHKTCPLNCVYCECGPTTLLTDERREYVNTGEVLEELSDFLKTSPHLDYITFSGSGEPTLHSRIGEMIKFIKSNFQNYKVALLTNGVLFTDESVIEEVKDADLIKPSLDAASDEVFVKINRPHNKLSINKIADGLINLRNRYNGKIYLEVFIVPGINDSPEEIKLISEIAKKIMPDKIQLNSLDRPPAADGVRKAELKELLKIASYFEPAAEIISRYDPQQFNITTTDIENLIIEMISRRPCTEEELKIIFSTRIKETKEVISRLLREKKIRIIKGPRGDYYGVS
ncbi:MAG: radical SAM protein [Deltaproteobacteria bacterium]|nr:radical SAM protein [Deltaproteobacteria bacterium]